MAQRKATYKDLKKTIFGRNEKIEICEEQQNLIISEEKEQENRS